MAQVILVATITCPICGFEKIEAMPRNACQHYYECEGCDAFLRPEPGDCCVFCSYADSVCPPKQLAAYHEPPLSSDVPM